MLEDYFCHPQSLRWLRLGPMGSHMNALAQHFKECGYSRHSARELLRGIAHFSRYAMWIGIDSPSDLTHSIGDRFLNEHLPTCSCDRSNNGQFSQAVSSVRHTMNFLERERIISTVPELDSKHDSIATVLEAFEAYLMNVRGLAPKTVDLHRRHALRFMADIRKIKGELELLSLMPEDVLDYFHRTVDYRFSLDWRRTLVSSLRVFLRFLRWERIVDRDLSRVIPPVIQWKLANIPRHIPFESVRTLINAPDVSTPGGKRDHAILVLIGLLGLRASEVLSLTLDQIDWSKKSLGITSSKGRKERLLPLVPEVEMALKDYILHGRPSYPADRLIFLSIHAPIHPLTSSGSLGTIVRKYIVQTQLDTPSKGTHLLRHSLATRLVNKGVPLKDIADVLGHSGLNTTRVYAKVDINNLKTVPLPFPSADGGE